MKFANVSQSLASKFTPTKSEPLRPGQILRGKVLQLYPNNKADIILGGKRFIANLEVGLELGGRYHFQVVGVDNLLELKVLGDQLKGNESHHLNKLLSELGIRNNRHHLTLVRHLTRQSIPFSKGELQQAFTLLKGEKNKGLATALLTEMISKKLPLTTETFQSLKASRETPLHDRLTAVIQELSSLQTQGKDETATKIRHQLGEQLTNALTELRDKPFSFRDGLVREIISQNKINNEQIFRTIRSLGLISSDVTFKTWGNEWTQFQKGTATTGNLPFNLNEQDFLNILERIGANRNEFIQAIQKLTVHWDSTLKIHEMNNQTLSETSFTSLRNNMIDILSPYLTRQIKMESTPNTGDQLITWYRDIQALGNPDNIDNLLQLVKHAAKHENFLVLNPKNQFLEHVFQSLKLLGLNYENEVVTNKNPQHVLETMKGLLLQLGLNEIPTREQQTKLLQHIQGLQLQSVNESQTMLQANLQIPAERLGLIQDLQLEFEGKKNKEGKIDTDFCRILFYLHLKNLGETVIDVNIQNRAISLTVFNNTEMLPLLTKSLKNKLDTNLEKLDYQLSSLTFKRLEDKSKSREQEEKIVMESGRGVDFRI